MKKTTMIAAGLLAASAGTALAGGIDRSGQSVAPLFEKGNYGELSFGYVSPTVSGTQEQTFSASSTAGAKSGDMAGSYNMPAFAFKTDLGHNLAGELIYDQPFGANVDYPAATSLPAYFLQGARATLTTHALTGLLKYHFENNVSVYGGVRWQTMAEHIDSLPLSTHTYAAQGKGQGAFGYVAGIAYEKPEIGLRVSLTYNSKIKYNTPTTEMLDGATVSSSNTPITTPQSVNLDAQTGINPTTLVFGSIRWVNWKQFNIDPTFYESQVHSPLVALNGNTTTYTLGLGHKFTDHWSGAVSLSYEPKVGGFSSNLAPTDGRSAVGLGATYTVGKVKITGGVRYILIGSANTTVDNTNTAAHFSGNHAIAAGVKVGFTF